MSPKKVTLNLKDTLCAKTYFTRNLPRSKCTRPKQAEAEVFVCGTCKKEFKRKCRLKVHERLHTGERPFTCDDCGKGFRSLDGLRTHQPVHSDKREFDCDKCRRSFKTSHQLKKHQRLTKMAMTKNEPNEHSPVKCKLCNYRITSRYAERLHMLTHKKKARPYVCSMCKESFAQLGQLGRHQRKKHEGTPRDGEEQLDCRICRKTFGNRAELRQHQQTHKQSQRVHQMHSYTNARRPFVCHRCGKSYGKSSSLGRHLATHFEVDPFRCASCKSEFRERSSYEEHRCMKQSPAKPKPILVVRFLSTNSQSEMAPCETASDSSKASVSNTAPETLQQVTSYQQQFINPTASETQDAQIHQQEGALLKTSSGDINLQLPVNKLGTEKKSIIIVNFLSNNCQQTPGDI